MAIIDFFLIVTKILVTGFFGFLFMGIIRKLAARFQNRIGPPIWQPILDFIKLLSKENIVSKRESPWTNLGPIISLAAYISVLFLLPIGLHFDFYGSVIWVIYLLFAGVGGYIIAGFASGNPYSGIGGSRELVQAFGFELPFIISLLVPTLKLLSITSSWF
ncbi:MAG TPA: hypothetical protein ENL46_03900, partial [Candidatus Aminicenantes bacterium]|nr:hypothetical protein [Candidatus Aminicenantes bacterium]